jgi:hypothetical protein
MENVFTEPRITTVINLPRVLGAEDADIFVVNNDFGALPLILTLPANPNDGDNFAVVDGLGSAATFPIRIAAQAAPQAQIAAATSASVTINQNWGGFQFTYSLYRNLWMVEAIDGTLAPPVPPPATLSFNEFFALMPGDNAAPVAAGAPVLFPQNGPASAVPAAARLTSSTFTLVVGGTYEVNWQVSVSEAGQLALALNGAILPNTVVGRATGTSQISGSSLITAAPGDVLSVISPAGNAAPLTITPIAGGTHSVSATLTIKKVG